MKRIFAMCMALMMVCSGAFAHEAIPGAEYLQSDIKNQIDLDNDGAPETIILKMEGVEGEESICLYLFGADGSFYEYDLYAMWLDQAFALDINGDGLKELFISCDFYSDDYVTYCFNYSEDAGMTALPFANIDRYSDGEAYSDAGYGRITGNYGSTITLTGCQDVLGSWMAGREFTLTDGRFDLAEGMYMFDISDSDWEDRPLILKQDLTVTDAGQSLPLKAGEKLLPVASDRESFVILETQGGRSFTAEIQFNEDYGWGWFVNGIYEEDLFEYVPYAD